MLSKSQYTKYLQCPKLFWLYRHRKDLLTPPSQMQQQIFDTGSAVGDLACQLFPGGTEIPFDISNVNGMVAKTKELINSGTTTIYEAAFLVDDLFVAVDILHCEQGKWHIYEVKSSTSVKDTYHDDAAVQAWALEQSGLSVGSINIVTINNKYERRGELDIEQLFTITDITDDARSRAGTIPTDLTMMKRILADKEPSQEIGGHCFSPYDCSAIDYCWHRLANIPAYSVFNLNRATIAQKMELYQSGIVEISAVPLTKRTASQVLQIREESVMDTKKIRVFVEAHEYPISHLDFESYQPAVPQFDRCKPFMQIPFQYSLHIEHENYLDHREFLAESGIDPRRSLAEKLIADMPKTGTILAYNAAFEKMILKQLAEIFPDLSSELNAIIGRMADLMVPFQKRWLYEPSMKGSYSIKKVLPALVPEMETSYANLPGVKNGGEASSIFGQLAEMKDPEEIRAVREGLLAYCGLDTLAMVKVLEVLRECVFVYEFQKMLNVEAENEN